jgi:hypothetical protein
MPWSPWPSRCGNDDKKSHGSTGHNIPITNFPKSSSFICIARAAGKLITRTSYLKVKSDQINFLEHIHSTIIHLYILWCSLMHIQYGQMCVSYDKEPCFCKAHHSNHKTTSKSSWARIKSIIVDNVVEFASRAFNDYCLALGTTVEHYVVCIHTKWSSIITYQEDEVNRKTAPIKF